MENELNPSEGMPVTAEEEALRDSGTQDNFEHLGIAPEILRALRELGFESPMPIQRMVIPHLLEKEGDVVGLAQTGTGKTAAFGVPVLQRTDYRPHTRVMPADCLRPGRLLPLYRRTAHNPGVRRVLH